MFLLLVMLNRNMFRFSNLFLNNTFNAISAGRPISIKLLQSNILFQKVQK